MKKISGFTLVEISVALVIVALLLAGVIGAYQNQLQANRIRETRMTLADIRDAIFGFTIGSGHLPCPADPEPASSTSGAGQEARDAENKCTFIEGVVPWATLGVRELDAWGGRFSYRVTGDFADFDRLTIGDSATCTPAPETADIPVSFAVCSAGDLIILSRDGALGVPTSVAVIVSHGRNRAGSWGPQGGSRLAGATGPELENANQDPTFLNGLFRDAGDAGSGVYYDDLVEWIPASLLVGKMAEAGRLP